MRFADSSFYFALLSKRDSSHALAAQLARSTPASTLTTEWVLVEVCDGLAAASNHRYATTLVNSIRADERMRVLSFAELGFRDAYELFASRADKSWSLIDCASFVAMRQFGITDALTADRHFEPAGFRALLKP
jgi:hypothetical protein